MIDLMLDIETLGRGPGCVVTSVAVVPFHMNGAVVENLQEETFTAELSIGLQVADGFKICPDTLEWWMKQDVDIRRDAFKGSETLSLFTARFKAYLNIMTNKYSAYRIWATAPKLDFGCLYPLFKGDEYPILFSAERCARTLRETTKLLYPEFKPARSTALHNAEDDCTRQISDIQQCWRLLQTKQITPGLTSERLKELLKEE